MDRQDRPIIQHRCAEITAQTKQRIPRKIELPFVQNVLSLYVLRQSVVATDDRLAAMAVIDHFAVHDVVANRKNHHQFVVRQPQEMPLH